MLSFTRKSVLYILFFLCTGLLFAQADQEDKPSYLGIAYLSYIEKAYPDVQFHKSYDSEKDDWRIFIIVPKGKNGKQRTGVLYWAGGCMLPGAELENKDKYWPILYSYDKELSDPAKLSEEEKEKIKKISSKESRKNGAGTPMFFFELLYNATSQRKLEECLVKTTFLGKKINIHERIELPLIRVENRIKLLAQTNTEVASFIKGIKSTDAYHWRIIEGTNRKSFHSTGVAIDVLPISQQGKQIFWSWAKDKYPETWMLIPQEKRWMPPEPVIRIFEQEGFIWGGKWIIFDNMHFEYHPELINYNFTEGK